MVVRWMLLACWYYVCFLLCICFFLLFLSGAQCFRNHSFGFVYFRTNILVSLSSTTDDGVWFRTTRPFKITSQDFWRSLHTFIFPNKETKKYVCLAEQECVGREMKRQLFRKDFTSFCCLNRSTSVMTSRDVNMWFIVFFSQSRGATWAVTSLCKIVGFLKKSSKIFFKVIRGGMLLPRGNNTD